MIGIDLQDSKNLIMFLSVARKKFFDYGIVSSDYNDFDFILTDYDREYPDKVQVVKFGKDIMSFEDLQNYIPFATRVDDDYVNSIDELLDSIPDEAIDQLPSLEESSLSEEMTLGDRDSSIESILDSLPLGADEMQDVLDDLVPVSIGENKRGSDSYESISRTLDDSQMDYDKLTELTDSLLEKVSSRGDLEPEGFRTPEPEIQQDIKINSAVDEALQGLFAEEELFSSSIKSSKEALETLREEKAPETPKTDSFENEETLYSKMQKEARTQEILSGFAEQTQTSESINYSAENESWFNQVSNEQQRKSETLRETRIEESVKDKVAQAVTNESTQSKYIIQSASPYNSLSNSNKPLVATHRISACFNVPNVPAVKPKQQSRQLRGGRQNGSSRRKVIIVGGAGYNSFSTTTAINLAYDYRRYYNKNALLIDLDCVSGGVTHNLNLDARTQCSIAALFTQDFKFYCNKLANFVATVNVGGISLDVITACFLDFINPVDRELIENYTNFSNVFLNMLESTNYETIIVDIGCIDRLTVMQSALLKNGNFLSLVCVNSESRQVLEHQAKALREVSGDYNVIFTKTPNVLNTARLSQQMGRNVIGQITDYPSPNVDLPLYSNMVNTPVQKEWYEILKTLLGVREY